MMIWLLKTQMYREADAMWKMMYNDVQTHGMIHTRGGDQGC